MKNLSNEKSPSRRRPCLVGATLPAAPAVRSAKSRHFSTQLQREDVPGCKQVPLENARGIVRWGHPDGYFLNAQGQKLAHNFGPAHQRGHTASKPSAGGFCGSIYPSMRQWGSRSCHVLMALAFYGERPTFKKASPLGGDEREVVGICHHLIPDKLDYRPANLLCWLTREEHREADRRQRAIYKALKEYFPDEDRITLMHRLSYEKHRYLQDPRTTCREVFEVELEKLRLQYKTNA